MKRGRFHIVLWLMVLGFVWPASAQNNLTPLQGPSVRADAFDGADVREHLGDVIPTDLTFLNAEGEPVELASYFDGETPVILNFVYHNCPMLCSVVLDELVKTAREVSLTPGADYRLLTISIDPNDTPETAQAQKQRYLERLAKTGADTGWHFLTGTQDAITTLTQASGFLYRWDAATEQFLHPAALILTDGTGTITRYLYGLTHPPLTFRGAIMEASAGTITQTVGRVLVKCFVYDPASGSWVANAQWIMKISGILVILLLGGFLWRFWRWENRRLTMESSTEAAPSGA